MPASNGQDKLLQENGVDAFLLEDSSGVILSTPTQVSVTASMSTFSGAMMLGRSFTAQASTMAGAVSKVIFKFFSAS